MYASRTVGLPFIPAEPDAWFEPLGVAAMIAEVLFIVVFIGKKGKKIVKSYYLKLTNKITLAFVILGLAIAIAGGIGLHYLDGIRLYQLQFEDEWEEYQRMVFAEDVLKEISTDISAWQAGMLPVAQLKSKSDELVHILSSWSRNEQEEEKIVDLRQP